MQAGEAQTAGTWVYLARSEPELAPFLDAEILSRVATPQFAERATARLEILLGSLGQMSRTGHYTQNPLQYLVIE
jgi:hypothetical protein